MKQLKIEPKFRDLCRKLTDEERDKLHIDIADKGVLSPIIVWEGRDIIVDGHNRYDYCQKTGTHFDVQEVFYRDEDAVIRHILRMQLGRRNLDHKTRKIYIGLLYETEKRINTKFRKGESANPGGKLKAEVYQNDTPESTRERIAREEGVSPATVMRYAKAAQECEALGITDSVLNGEIDPPAPTRKGSKTVSVPREWDWDKSLNKITKYLYNQFADVPASDKAQFREAIIKSIMEKI